MFDNIVKSCNYLLNNFPEAQESLDYLSSRINKDSQELFQFGYFPSTNNLEALTSLVSIQELEAAHLFYSKTIEDSLYPRVVNFSYFEDYPLIMPFKNSYGKIVALVGRSLLSDTERQIKKIPKYKNTVETAHFKKSNLLFGLFENKQNIIKKDAVYIVEGQFDVIKARENGFDNVVALGNAHMSSYQFSVISRYTDNIFLLLDNDEAGNKGRKKVMENFETFANIRNVYLPPEFKDIDDFFKHNSLEDLSFIMKD